MTPNKADTFSNDNLLPRLVAPQADNWKFIILGKDLISYKAVAVFTYFHLSGIYGLYLSLTEAHYATVVQALLLIEASTLGLLAGAHRLWAHRSYKAKLNLQILLMIFQSIGNTYTVLNWVKDHRLHHRHSDTDADPHNATRGFFFSHVGWLLVHKHPEVKRRGATTDMSDILSNPVLVFQEKYQVPVIILFAFILPTIIPVYLWHETFITAYYVNICRIVLGLNMASLINSLAHSSGSKPYDKDIRPTENMVVQLSTLGEGSHNYHHAFPWDYRAAELAMARFNLTSTFIELFAKIGWAYDLKTVERRMVSRRAKKFGDGSYLEIDVQDEDVLKND